MVNYFLNSESFTLENVFRQFLQQSGFKI